MGRNGGFNPYRDRNGEFTTPQGSGKPGRSRVGPAAQNWQGGKSKGTPAGGTGGTLDRLGGLGAIAARADARAQAKAATLTPRQRSARATAAAKKAARGEG